ncbi:hypothetical protein C8J57DRAFT_987995, partial [Mycena rebaudengoi]
GLTWLIEHKRPTTVTKFSGTLVHQSGQKDLCSQTICAFTHFVFGFSNGWAFISDSSVGDFGQPGIDMFKKDHRCNSICHSLNFPMVYPLNENKSGEGPE